MGDNDLGRAWGLCNCERLHSGKASRAINGHLMMLPFTDQMAAHHTTG